MSIYVRMFKCINFLGHIWMIIYVPMKCLLDMLAQVIQCMLCMRSFTLQTQHMMEPNKNSSRKGIPSFPSMLLLARNKTSHLNIFSPSTLPLTGSIRLIYCKHNSYVLFPPS